MLLADIPVISLSCIALTGLMLYFVFRRRPDREAKMYERFTDRARKVMQLANEEAQRFNHEYIGTEHVLLGLIKEGSGVASNVLKNLDLDLRKIRLEVEKIVQYGPSGEPLDLGRLPHTPRTKKVIEYSVEEARQLNHNYVGTEHLLLGLLREQEGVAAQVLMNLGLNLAEVREEVLSILGHTNDDMDDDTENEKPDVAEEPSMSGPWLAVAPKSDPPSLIDKIAADLTELARNQKLDTLIGRRADLNALIEVLACRHRGNALILGELGVGKVSLVAGLAHAIVAGTVPYFLRTQRILELRLIHFLDLGAEASLRNARATAIFNAIRRLTNTIVFLPDMIESLGTEGESSTLRNLYSELVVTLRENQVPCILTASPGDYHRFVARRSSLDPFVQPVYMRPANREETMEILNGVRTRFEEFHQVKISDEAIKAIVESADRRLPGALPGKAIQLLDRCAARTRIRSLSLSEDEAASVRSIDEQLERLGRKLEEFVDQQDFQQAAAVRDERDRLKKSKDWLLQDKARDAVVHVELIEVVVRDLAVETPTA